jgi:glycerol-3-phosphate dehydrogenase
MGSLDRNENLARLREGQTWDIVIIGGGATGLGSAVDAASRGHRTLLLESQDFAHGTSSKSTKLIHGGVRYLAQGNISLVREALHERGVLLAVAPHLVHRREFVVPAYSWLDLPFYGAGLKLYDALAGQAGLGKSRWLSRSEVIERVTTIQPKRLHGGILYEDAQFDDARLAITLARTFTDLGGSALNYTSVTGLEKRDGKLAIVRALDRETGETFAINTRAIINATGVFADTVRQLDDPSAAPMLAPSQGAHVVLDRTFLPGETALLVPKTDDGRVLFAIPWHGRVIVGTTDTPIANPPAEPVPSPDEIDYILAHAGRYLSRAPTRADILSTFAGLRPLLNGKAGASTARLSREHAVEISRSGLVTITGGKWTTYRPMGIDAVNHAEQVGNLPRKRSATANLALHGHPDAQVSTTEAMTIYGSDAPRIEAMIRETPALGEQVAAGLPYRGGEVAWAARHEAARTVEDILARRTRALFLDARASIAAAPAVATILAAELGRDDSWRDRQTDSFRQFASAYLPKVDP